MSDCIFCKIAGGEIPCEKVYESERVLAFRDINPVAPVHVLIIPKEHIPDAASVDSSNSGVLSEIFEAAAQVARLENLSGGFRVVSNAGEDARQTVNHLHFHILGGRRLDLRMG